MGNHLFVIFAVLDVSFAVNSCLNRSFFYIVKLKDGKYLQLPCPSLLATPGFEPTTFWAF